MYLCYDQDIEAGLQTLSSRERFVIEQKYTQRRFINNIANDLKITVQAVYKIEKRALLKLRAFMET